MIFKKDFLSEIPLFMANNKFILITNSDNQIEDEGCKGLGDGIRTLVNLTSL